MKETVLRSVKGTHDILPDESPAWQKLEQHVHDFMQRYGYAEIRTPVFERTELFARGVGAETDIVSKEMYTFQDMGGTSITLKPELTAPVIRSYLQNNLGKLSPLTKLYYIDHAFRQERPQKGRYRQFHQYGVEALGSEHPELDAEILAVAYFSLVEMGLDQLTVKLNSIGSTECRVAYRSALHEYLRPHLDDLSETSRRRFDLNPLRILDTKIPHEIELMQGAPNISDHLTKEDSDHYSTLKALLNELAIPFTEDAALVRGLDYYTRTTFEITSPALGAQNSICGGGRYDGLIETLGGQPTPGIGFAAGIERVLLALEAQETLPASTGIDAFLAIADDESRPAALKILQDLRSAGLSAETDYLRRSLKAQLREANRLNAANVVFINTDDIKNNTVQVKNLVTGDQTPVKTEALKSFLNK